MALYLATIFLIGHSRLISGLARINSQIIVPYFISLFVAAIETVHLRSDKHRDPRRPMVKGEPPSVQ